MLSPYFIRLAIKKLTRIDSQHSKCHKTLVKKLCFNFFPPTYFNFYYQEIENKKYFFRPGQ